MMEFNAGLLDGVGYYMRVYEMSEDAAKKIIADIASRVVPEDNPPE
jgi:hypothetical protein